MCLRPWLRWALLPAAELRAPVAHAREAAEHRPPTVAAVEAASAAAPATVGGVAREADEHRPPAVAVAPATVGVYAADEHHEGFLL